MDNKSKNLKDWDKFLNKEEVKKNLLRSSLFLYSYELLKNSIVDKVKEFYWRGFENGKDIISEVYTDKVLNRKINGKQNIFLSSLHWLEENGVITKEDIVEISAIREFRDTVAHKIDKLLADSDLNFNEDLENKIFTYINKIERWWIIEFELDPDEEENSEEIISGREIFYLHIKNVVDELLNNSDSTEKAPAK